MNQNQTQPPEPPARNNRRRLLLIPILLLLIVGGLIYWLSTRGKAATDDAQVEGHLIPISPRVSGHVKSILVRDNQQVRKGDVLVLLDPRDLSSKLQMSEAALATQNAQAAAAKDQVSLVGRTAPAGEEQAAAAVKVAQAGVTAAERQIAAAEAQARSADAGVAVAKSAVTAAESDVNAAEAQIQSAQAAIRVSEADVTAAKAQAKKASDDAARYRQMFEQGAVPKQQLEAMETAATSADAALKAAEEHVHSARAGLEQARARRSGAEAAMGQARGRLSSARAAADQACEGVRVAQAVLKEATGRLKQALANETAAGTAPQQIAISKSQATSATARARQAEADLRNARLQFSYIEIRAPEDGQVSQKTVQLGQYVQPGQALMSLVPLKNTWVVANFKETQIEKMRIGQRADISVDTYPGATLRGHVNSIAAATGAKFSLLPPENATGNYVKVVARIPVKIVLDRPLPRGVVLRPGQNVVATVFL